MKEYDSAKELHASTVYIEQIVVNAFLSCKYYIVIIQLSATLLDTTYPKV